ncbi:YciI family protein [Longispora sp. K20-0274]|uniref:YciI family protein n=1 Tax=Longispora sp. K20-0274 TaxID=3088255 RepID=UPI00399B11C3
MLSIYVNDDMFGSITPERGAELEAADAAFRSEITESGELVSTEGLLDPADAKVVRLLDGSPVVTSGRHLDTKDRLGHYFIVDVKNEDRAIELAAKYQTPGGFVEVFPVYDAG